MTIELGIFICMAAFLAIIILLLISVLKGLAAIMDQQSNILKKQSEWVDTLLDSYSEDGANPKIIIDNEDEKPITDEMMNEGLRQLDDLLDQKSE